MLTRLTPVATLLTIHDASGQRDAVASCCYQFSSARVPIRICVVMLRGVQLAILQQLDCGRGLDTGVVALAVA